MQIPKIPVDLLTHAANCKFTKGRHYPTRLGLRADFVLPNPGADLGRFLDRKLDALVHHGARFPRPAALQRVDQQQPQRFGRLGGLFRDAGTGPPDSSNRPGRYLTARNGKPAPAGFLIAARIQLPYVY